MVQLVEIPLEEKKDEKLVKWLRHYSSAQSILIVGDGDFSFSRALATAFGSGENIVATSLDSYGSTPFPLPLASRSYYMLVLPPSRNTCHQNGQKMIYLELKYV